jgi:hypothetical protein
MLELFAVRKLDFGVSQRVVRLLGPLGAAGMQIKDLKQILRFLRKPSELSLSMLQTLKSMITLDDTIMKAFPTSFFNLGGARAGLFLPKTPWPFPREYQLTMWFRLEGEQDPRGPGIDGAHLFTCTSATGEGVDITINKCRLAVTVQISSAERFMFSPGDSELHPGVWYNLTVTHMRPRIALFGRDEFSVVLDFHEIFRENIRYPTANAVGEVTEFSIGRNFDGQIGTAYILHESLPPAVIQVLGKHDANKVSEVQRNTLFGTVVGQSSAPSSTPPPDISASVIGERRTLGSRAVAVLHAARCVDQCALDIHGGRHAKFGVNTHSWTMASARDVISSLGGMKCLVPLFPRLLIENESLRQSIAIQTIARLAANTERAPSHPHKKHFSEPRVSTVFYGHPSSRVPSSSRRGSPLSHGAHLGLGLPLSILNEDELTLSQFGAGTTELLRVNDVENNETGVLALIISIFARCLRGHIQNQKEVHRHCLVDMMEYAVYCIPQSFLRFEGEHAVLALLSLKSAVATLGALEVREEQALQLLRLAVLAKPSLIVVMHSTLSQIASCATSSCGAGAPFSYNGFSCPCLKQMCVRILCDSARF